MYKRGGGEISTNITGHKNEVVSALNYVIKHHVMKAYGERMYTDIILDLGTRCEWSALCRCCFTPGERPPPHIHNL
jgi:hypothetical protein